MKKKLIVLSGIVLGFAPVVALAQINTTGAATGGCNLSESGTLFGVLCQIGRIFNSIVPVLIALGVLYFVWGVITYVISSDEEAKKAGRDRIIFGIIGLAVIIGVWGLVNFLRNTFGLDNTTNLELPTIPTSIDNFRTN
ncbi:hypothetical protein A3D42_00530 [Candidatus Nomurabacteria bacterium RIFCSPHIGHO2_02_FULL_41_18]|uniref:DUF4190 domain-containing protein n=1 Tax=Candidatus Nomurabacteria bacterium RIFCSPHIGHO2_02_FULL_41_18 TaxID=1801754 RepID=A0A1F6W7Z8_9BACT|nr:MAG: hypothetical protein A2737_02565 [Candidatus Nomurabacteria bacterium RIFCSPHIGHO2_01_FULL_41_71]OGI77906.1 MAG: hypothetical protein A3D42_00530 [Candidatus Nomurabacteria bacterium RIFCSPHIGHO2_02_FULL_41_18]OGI90080.1 MAG: hypothetical protein A3B01_00950 [Candidatus Nomurabacteria bacterium RIFCSPLOWO2_01_FULL_41_52b]